MRDTKRKRLVLLAAAAILILVVGLVSIWFSLQNVGSSTTPESGTATDDRSLTASVSPAPEQDNGGTTAHLVHSDQGQAEGTGQDFATPPDDDDPTANTSDTRTVIVRFVDENGSPMGGFRFRWRAWALFEFSGLARSGLANVGSQLANTGEADSRGEWRTTVDVMDVLAIKPVDAGLLHLATANATSVPALMRRGIEEPSFHFIFARLDSQATLRVESRWAAQVRVDVVCEYADGQRFEGVARWLLRERRGDDILRVIHGKEYQTCPELLTAAGPPGWELRVVVENLREGYKAHTRLDVPLNRETTLQNPHKLVIPADSNRRPPTFIEIDCTALSANAQVKLSIVAVGLNQAFDEISVTRPEVVRTRDLIMLRNPFVVRMHGDFAWESEPIQLQPGETRRVVAQMQASAAVRARVVDQHGEAVWPAVILAGPQKRMWWRSNGPSRPMSTDGMIAHVGKDGVGELTGAAPGTQEIRIDAPRFEQHRVTVELLPGGTADLGTIVLEPASGSVVVALDPIPEGGTHSFTASLMLAGGRVYANAIAFGETGRATFEMLPSGDYQIFVQRSGNPYGWSKHVTVQRFQSVHATIDVTQPPGKQD